VENSGNLKYTPAVVVCQVLFFRGAILNAQQADV